MVSGAAWSVFQTEAQAKTHEVWSGERHGQIRLEVKDAVQGAVDKGRADTKAIEQVIHKMDKKLSVIGASRGLGPAMRRIDEEHTSDLEDR